MTQRWLPALLWLAAATAMSATTATASGASASIQASPQAPGRSNAQNFKDIALATCLATAYKASPAAATDAASSVSALRDWSLYDLEAAPDAIRALVDSHLARDYSNPLADAEAKGVRFDLLKCLDLYHGKELAALAKRLVIHPQRSYGQDKPPRGASR